MKLSSRAPTPSEGLRAQPAILHYRARGQWATWNQPAKLGDRMKAQVGSATFRPPAGAGVFDRNGFPMSALSSISAIIDPSLREEVGHRTDCGGGRNQGYQQNSVMRLACSSGPVHPAFCAR